MLFFYFVFYSFKQAAQTILVLSILDVGNTAPRILVIPVPNPQAGVLTIPEDTSIETVVATVKTKDSDQGENGYVDCFSISPLFKMKPFDEKSYLVEIAKELDREKLPEINVTVICKDRGKPQLSDSGSFLIKLSDVNDNKPRFTKNIYRANLTENNRRGRHVLFVKANDRDLGMNAKLHYSISMESNEASFLINEQTGEVTAGTVFDRETVTKISFMVKVEDMGNPALTGQASVIINILDKNDQTPYFTSTIEFEIAEDLPSTTVVGKLKGADKDIGKNAKFSFSIPQYKREQEGDQIPFVVFPDGLIRTDRVLKKDVQERYTFPVVITDHGQPSRSSNTTVIVRVIDANDHVPKFIFPSQNNNSVYISSNARIGTIVAVLRAWDEDQGRNGRITYHINGHSNDLPFYIPDPKKGEIVLMSKEKLLKSAIFRLNVSAHDQGIPVHKTTTVISILVDFEEGVLSGRAGDSGNGDGTGQKSGNRGTDIKYIIIAGVVGGITVIISIIIVIIIFLIRRPERNSRPPVPSGVQEQGDERHFDKQLWQSVPIDDISPTRVISEKKLGGDIELNGDTDYPEKPSNGGFNANGSRDIADTYGRKHIEIFQAQPHLYTFKKVSYVQSIG